MINHYYTSKSLKIFYSEDFLFENFIRSLDNDSFIFYQIPFNIEADLDGGWYHYFNFISEYNPNFDLKANIIFCSPSKRVHDKIIKDGYSSIMLNHNCFLDFNIFKTPNSIPTEVERPYDCVINSRPFTPKRIFLADKIKSLAYIKGYDWTKGNEKLQSSLSTIHGGSFIWDGWKRRSFALLESVISPERVLDIYSKSKMGIMLSGHTGDHPQGPYEGANYSSSEYLLCGLPIISTPSQGGRDEWFTDQNSIICEPNKDSVYNAYLEMLEKINTNNIDRLHIIEEQIKKMKAIRENFISKTQELFNSYSIEINARKIFEENYFHKMIRWKDPSYINAKKIKMPWEGGP